MSSQNLLLITGLSPNMTENDIFSIFNIFDVLYIKILRNHEKTSYGIACVCTKYNLSKDLALIQLNNYLKLKEKGDLMISILQRDCNTRNILFIKMGLQIDDKELFKFYSKFGNMVYSQNFNNFSDYKIGMIIYDNDISTNFALNQTNNLTWKGYKLEAFYLFNRLYRINKHNTVCIKVNSSNSKLFLETLRKRFSRYGEIQNLLTKWHNNFPIPYFSVLITYSKSCSKKKICSKYPFLKLNDIFFRKTLRKILNFIKNQRYNLFKISCISKFIFHLIQSEDNIEILSSDKSLLQSKINNYRKYYMNSDRSKIKIIKYFSLNQKYTKSNGANSIEITKTMPISEPKNIENTFTIFNNSLKRKFCNLFFDLVKNLLNSKDIANNLKNQLNFSGKKEVNHFKLNDIHLSIILCLLILFSLGIFLINHLY